MTALPTAAIQVRDQLIRDGLTLTDATNIVSETPDRTAAIVKEVERGQPVFLIAYKLRHVGDVG